MMNIDRQQRGRQNPPMTRFFPSLHLMLSWTWRQRHRFLKFGLVGLSGVFINQAVLWVCQEYLFAAVDDFSLRLNLSMAAGILLSMTNNFHWNRRWTWRDRDRATRLPILHQYLQYAAANWAGIVAQVAITNLLSQWMPYLLANLFGIGMGCVVNFLLNDLWTFRHVRTEGMPPQERQLERARMSAPLIVIGLILALCTYFQGLGSLHILRNGDELVYAQITRVTGLTDRWLPLESGMPDMRNTKPPLLFWQGLSSTAWGHHWTPTALRWPSVLWTFGVALLCGLLGWRMSGRDVLRGGLAALFYLAFFTTYRYGRPYLTNAPETFWMFACFFAMLWWKPRSFDSRFLFPTIVGALAGMALLTKSFAQLVPIAVGLSWWHLHVRGWRLGEFVRRSLPGILWTSLLSLGMFSLWFLLDPQPEAIWREFVLKENVGKMGSGIGAWLRGLLWSGDSVWTLAGSWFTNAGLLAFPLFALMVESWRHRNTLQDEERLLWIWVFAIFFVFSIPSERSGRYLIEGMPALAVLLALRCDRLGRYAFVLTLATVIAILMPIGYLSLLLAREVGMQAFAWWHWLLVAAGVGFAAAAMARPRWTAICSPTAVLSVFLSLSSFISVFDGPLGVFDKAVIEATADRVVWVPENFRSKAESHRFLLPRAVVRGFPVGSTPDAALCGPDDFVIVQRPLNAPAPVEAIGSRMDLTSRHKAWQIWEMATGEVKKHLFKKEYVVPAASL
jgi:putative flippase GtrA